MIWRCNLYDPDFQPEFVPYDSSPSDMPLPKIYQIEVNETQRPPPGMRSDFDDDYVFRMWWTDKDGKHDAAFTAAYEAVRHSYNPIRVAGVYTSWGRIEIHIERARPNVYAWIGKGTDVTATKIKPSRY
jgi:hypothetical protein